MILRPVLISVLLLLRCAAEAAAETPQFLTFEEAQPVLRAMKENLPAGLKGPGPLIAEQWADWVRKEDAAIRARLDRGEEDTLTNLLRFGVTYTKEYRIDDSYLLRYGESTLVNAFAETRANDLIRAMASGSANEGIAHMRSFLEQQGYSFKTRADQKKIKGYLLANLKRMRDDLERYVREVQHGNRFQLFEDRGISLDTNLWPDFLLDRHLASMVQTGLLKPGSVRRVAIVGPGLDFANKDMGNDFYPRQSIQPFAVLDSLIRLGLCEPASVEVFTLDISPEVNFHLQRARKNAAGGIPYTLQLPWNTRARMTPEYRAAFTQYWETLGSGIGRAVPAIPVPGAAAAETRNRAVEIRPEIVLRVTPLDANIVFERPGAAPGQGFDLIVGTNIFIYFGEFEQALARMNMALMLHPGGFVLSSDRLASPANDGLFESLRTEQVVALDPDRTDYIFSYIRKE